MGQKIWLQQENESDLQYKRFEDFLKFNDKLNNYANEQETSKNGLTSNSLKKLATKFNWIKRKNAFFAHKQKNISNDTEELKNKNYFQIINQIETLACELYESVHRTEIEILKFSLAVREKAQRLKKKIGYKENEEPTIDDISDIKNDNKQIKTSKNKH